ncbi:NADP-dependent oxidoreductase [Caulobacter sp. KR2-114]|uniref:NADP-dependent oxidoreductase n=1 Tax=Caulobacter sp. KR2-114 TaxID=3400912 RepID=UPI003C10DAB7
MSDQPPADGAMRALRLHQYGEPGEVLRLEPAPIPVPAPGAIRVRVAACALNPADWALCRGLFARDLPRGVGLDVAGVVDAVGEGVSGPAVGDAVFGPANYLDHPSAGAADFAILDHWAAVPAGLDMPHAAALTMAVETAWRNIDWLGVAQGQTLLVNGAGSMVGFAAAQMARLRGARVIAAAGPTFADRLTALGATVVPYGPGLVERVRALGGAAPDLVFDSAPVNLKAGVVQAGDVQAGERGDGAPGAGGLADLVQIVGGDARRVLTCVDFARAAQLGVRNGLGETPGGPDGAVLRYDVLDRFARLAAEGRFSVPVARTFPLDAWREALAISLDGRARGKLVLLMSAAVGEARAF